MARIRALRLLLAATLLALTALSAVAQDARSAFPVRPVRLVVAFAPGGPADIVARLISQKLGDGLGQAVVVENRGGAGGNVAAQQVARGAADGHTVLLTTSALAVAPGYSASPGFDIERDFTPVAGIAAQPSIIVAHPGVPAATLQELLAVARGGKLNFATAGNGTSPHLAGEYLFKVLAKVNVPHVPFNGGGPALQAAIGGNVELVVTSISPTIPLVKAGKLRAIATTGPRRSAALPEVPTIAESGFAGFEDRTWIGLFVPAAVPAAAVKRLHDETERVLQAPDIRERMAAIAFDPMGGPREAFAQFVRMEAAKYARFVKEAGIRGE